MTPRNRLFLVASVSATCVAGFFAMQGVGARAGAGEASSRSSASAAEPSPAILDSGVIWGAIKKAAPGDTVRIPPGAYSALRLDGFKGAGVITIVSEDPKQRVVIRGIHVTNSRGLTFRDMDVTVDPRLGFAVMLGGVQDVRLEGLQLYGSAIGDGNAVMVRNSANVTVADSNIHHLGTGLNHLNSDTVEFRGNRLHAIQADGIRGGGSSNVTISGNRFTNFYPRPGDHPDAIQFWTRNVATPSRNILITDNVFVRGAGGPIQGIFVGNESQITYETVIIRGNSIIGGMYHGISLTNGSNVVVENNIVQGYADMTSWISVGKTSNSRMINNSATDYKFPENKDFQISGNKRLKLVAIGNDSILQGSAPPKSR